MILAAGWSAVTYPALLVASSNTADPASDRSRARWQVWPRVLERSREELTRHAVILLVLLGSERDRMERQMSRLQAEHGGGTTNPSWRQLLRMVLRAMAGRRGRAAWRRIRWTGWTVGHALRRVISTPPTEP